MVNYVRVRLSYVCSAQCRIDTTRQNRRKGTKKKWNFLFFSRKKCFAVCFAIS